MVLVIYSFILGTVSAIISVSWFLYLLVLVFLGGVIVLVIYIRTLAANEKFDKLSFNKSFFFLILIYLYLDNRFIRTKRAINTNLVINLYESNYRIIMVFLIRYLLLTILCVVKLVKFDKGPLVGRL